MKKTRKQHLLRLHIVTKEPIVVEETILWFVGIGNLNVLVWFEAVDNFAVEIWFRTSFIKSIFMECSPVERKPYHSILRQYQY